MTKFNTLKIVSKSNPDWNGLWDRDTVSRDMIDLGYDNFDPDNGWLYWILEHDIDSDEFTPDMEKMIVDEHCHQIALTLNEGDLTITKF